MMRSLLEQSAEKMLAVAEAASPQAGRKQRAQPSQSPRPPRDSPPAPGDEEDAVLDLSAFLATPPASRARRATAGEEADDEIFDLDADAPSAAGGGPLLNSWTYDSSLGEVKFSQVPDKQRRAGGAQSQLSGLLALAEGGGLEDEDGAASSFDFYADDDGEEEEEEGPYSVEAAEAFLPPFLRVPTSLQRVDVNDADDVIDALSQLNRLSLDKESQAILDEEVQRKLKVSARATQALFLCRVGLSRGAQEREKKQKRVVNADPTPPGGKRKTHRQLAIIAGSVRLWRARGEPRALTPAASQAQNYKLWSPQDLNTRPMMAAVRAAVFSMLTALHHGNGQTGGLFPPGLRWLDLFAGTGAVGLEALSRGVTEAHFVELDPWVIAHCLRRNLEHTRCESLATVHNVAVEPFLAAAAAAAAAEVEGALRPAAAAFDFISVCPPYEKVSYPGLMASLEASPLVRPGTLILVEYPKYERDVFAPSLGRLVKIRDRAYGRTFLALYECVDAEGELPSEGRARARLDADADE